MAMVLSKLPVIFNSQKEMKEYFEARCEEDFVDIAQGYCVGAVLYNAGEYFASGCRDKETKRYIKNCAIRQLRELKKITLSKRFQLWLVAKMFWAFGIIYYMKKVRK